MGCSPKHAKCFPKQFCTHFTKFTPKFERFLTDSTKILIDHKTMFFSNSFSFIFSSFLQLLLPRACSSSKRFQIFLCLDKGSRIIGSCSNFKNVVLIWRTHFKPEYWYKKNISNILIRISWLVIFQFITNKSGRDQNFVLYKFETKPSQNKW